MQRTSSSGVISATSRHTGLPTDLAHRSHTALTTAPVAGEWPLVRPDPAQLAVAGEAPPEGAHVGGDILQPLADDLMLQRADRRAADLVAAADGERQPVPLRSARSVSVIT